jgi:hypothetical protein
MDALRLKFNQTLFVRDSGELEFSTVFQIVSSFKQGAL